VTLPNADALALNHGNSYSITASVKDIAGNSAVPDTNNKLVVDIAVPDVPTVVNLKTNSTTPTVSGRAQKTSGADTLALANGDTIAVSINGQTITATIDLAAASGTNRPGVSYNPTSRTWAVDTSVANGFGLQQNTNYNVGVRVTSGNVSKEDVSTQELQISNVAPVITIGAVSGDNKINAADQVGGVTVSGTTTANVGSTVRLSGLDGQTYEATVVAGTAGTNTFSVLIPGANVAGFTPGNQTLTARVTNAFGNSGSDTQAVEVDFVVPTIAITGTKTTLGLGETDTITFTLSEVSTDFVASDIAVTGGTLGPLSGSGTVYTATFTRTDTTQGSVRVSVGNAAFSDAAGNFNADGDELNNTITFGFNNNGNDTIDGGNGNDTIDGGNGNDSIDGGDGEDTIDGGNGNDSIDGGNGNDSIDGGDGNDTIEGGNGNDTIDGGNGNDSINGGNGNDSIDGGDGEDTIDEIGRAHV
jgi:hypothetical protein